MPVNEAIVLRALEAVRALSKPARAERCQAALDTVKMIRDPQEASECGPECYKIELGKRIHRPWTGQCNAKVQASTLRQVVHTCWHCSGATVCGCISCAEGLPAGAGWQCLICKGAGKVIARVQ